MYFSPAIFRNVFFLLVLSTTQLEAQALVGKWETKGYDQKFHFTADGLFRYQTPDNDAYGLYQMDNNTLVIVPMNDSDNALFYELSSTDRRHITLTEVESGSAIPLTRLGAPEIPSDMALQLEPIMAEWRKLTSVDNSDASEENNEGGIETTPANPGSTYGSHDSSQQYHSANEIGNKPPKDLSLVGCWEDVDDIGSPFVFDENGFFKHGDYNGDDRVWGYEGLYEFDGQTLTVHVHAGGGLSMTVGESYTYPIENLSRSNMTMNHGKIFDGSYYKPRYRKTSRYQITSRDKNTIQAVANTKNLTDTKWRSGGTDYLFLQPDYLIVRKNGHSNSMQWHFNGNTLWMKEISGRNDDYTQLGVVTRWTHEAITLSGSGGNIQLKSGKNVANLSSTEQSLYINYLKLNQAATFQAIIGIGQGAGLYDVEWRY